MTEPADPHALPSSAEPRDRTASGAPATGAFSAHDRLAHLERELRLMQDRLDEALRESELRERTRGFLSDATVLLASSLDIEATLRELTELAVAAVADIAVTFLVDDDGAIRVAGSARARGAADRGADGPGGLADAAAARDLVARVIRSRRPLLLRDVEEELLSADLDDEQRRLLDRLGARSAILVPLHARGRVLGALCVAAAGGGRPPYHDADLTLVRELAARAALGLDNARLFREVEAARADAEAASRAKSQFLAIISHELRTPLTAVIGYADLLGTGVWGELGPKQLEQIGRMKASAWHLAGIIDEILTFTRADAGKEQVHLDRVELGALASNSLAVVDAEARGKGVRLEIRLPDEPLWIRTDPGKVRQILLYLLGNAVKFTDEGEVEVELESDDGGASLHVRDTGPGVPEDQVERIFEPFAQLDDSNTRSKGGAGLGLTVGRRLAHLLGGEVAVASNPGGGATFTLRLPAAVETAAPPPASAASAR